MHFKAYMFAISKNPFRKMQSTFWQILKAKEGFSIMEPLEHLLTLLTRRIFSSLRAASLE